MKSLNKSFLDWFRSELKTLSATADLSAAAKDYVDYSAQLEDRYLKSFGEVLTFGSGDCGQLAQGNEEENLMVKYPRIVYSLRDKKVIGISCGGLHNAVFTESGQVYTWGCSDDGSLGRPGDETIPTLVETLASENVIGVACGDGQTLAFTTAGEVWGWGCYKDKEGGKWFNPDPNSTVLHKDIKKQQNLPIPILGLNNIVEVACGTAFNLARTATGEVYSWGIGECGELGRDTVALKGGKATGGDPNAFMKLVYEQHIRPGPMYMSRTEVAVSGAKAIGCGSYHAMVVIVGDGNIVLSCGLNNYSQLGHSDKTDCSRLHEITSLRGKGVISVKGGMHHSLVLTSSGRMFAFGRSDYCQLGIPSTSNKSVSAGDCSLEPVEPLLTVPAGTSANTDIKVTQISCGGNHNLALVQVLTAAGSAQPYVYTWGYGDMLALGHGVDADEAVPRKLDFVKAKISNISVTQVAGGGQHSAIIGKVFST